MLKVVTIQKSVKVRIYSKEPDKELLSKRFSAKNILRQGLNLMSGLGTKPDFK